MVGFLYGIFAQLPDYRKLNPVNPDDLKRGTPAAGHGGKLVIADASSALAWITVLAALVALLVAAALWAAGSKSGNQDQVFKAKSGAIAAILAAFLVGAIIPVMNFFIERANVIQYGP